MPFSKVVRYVLLRPLRPELEVIQNNCRVRFVGISQYVHFRHPIYRIYNATAVLELPPCASVF
jgi:hypothetical protein